ncbi:MAG: OmpH family outer membrane protein [Bacteroidaceae bacterium]|mgnify:CR=1 FL=1|nr:OmpH family outer membrane protein [Bacteroidaceae bacterium]
MKKILFVILMLAPMSIFAQKFAHFNMAEVLPNMAEYQAASAEIQKLSAQYQEEYDRLIKEYQTKAEELQKLDEAGNTAQAILQSKAQDLQKMQQSIQEFGQASQQDLEKQQGEKMQAIQTKVMAAITKLGEAGGYVYVVDTSSGVIPFVNPSLSTDITAQVKAELGIK